MTIDTEVGRYLLAFAGEDARFAANPQFRLQRHSGLKSWAVVHDAAARNPTFLNGLALPAEAAAVKTGDVLSVGPERIPLRVEIRD